MKKLVITLGASAALAFAVLAIHSPVAEAKDFTQSDFYYDAIRTDQTSLPVFMQQSRLAVEAGDYHGLGVVSAVPAAPPTGVVRFFNLSGVGYCSETSAGLVTTLPGNVTVTTYPDAGFVATATNGEYVPGLTVADGGLVVVNGATTDTLVATASAGVDGGVTIQGKAVPAVMAGVTGAIPGIQVNHTNVGTPYTFNPTFSATPECSCTDITSAAAVKCLTSGGPPVTTLTMTGTGTDTISFVCVGPR